MVLQVSGNDFNSWFHLNRNALPFGQRMGMVESSQTPNQPVKTEPTPIDNYQITQPFAMNVGGVQGPTSVNPVQGVARTESVGHVAAEDGSQISMGGQGQGFYTVMAPGAGDHYTNGVGHAKHTMWLRG